MKQNLLVSIFFVFSLVSFLAGAQNYCGGSIKGGDGIPWPYGSETKFSAKYLQGTWSATSEDCTNQFIFKVSESSSGRAVVKVTQYDPIACKVVGYGSGFLSDKVTTIRMNKKGGAYNMTIHVFNQTDVQEAQNNQHRSIAGLVDTRRVFVINLFAANNWLERTTYEIVKVDNSANMVCQ